MSGASFWVFYACALGSILVFRCAPLFLLKGRELPPRVVEALGLIPPAAFAALVANDFFAPAAELSVVPFLSAAAVVLVARKTGSLIWCALAGMGVYAALGALL